MRDTIEMAREAGFMLIAESVEGQSDWWECFDEEIEKLVALVRADAIANAVADERSVEREKFKHNEEVLMNALWKACGDDEEVVNATIESQGKLK
jgi:hypothetical protein